MPAAMDSRPASHRKGYVGRNRGLRKRSGIRGVELKGSRQSLDTLLDSFPDRPPVEQLGNPMRDTRDIPHNLD